MGFFQQLKKTNKKVYDMLLGNVRKEGKNQGPAGRAAQGVASAMVPVPAKIALRTLEHSKSAKDVAPTLVEESAGEADKEAEVIGQVGTFLVVVGAATGQPELVAAGAEASELEGGIKTATAGAKDVARASRAAIRGDTRAAVIALGNAVRKYGVAIMDNLSEGEFTESLEIAEDILKGDTDAAAREAARALIKGVLNTANASHLLDVEEGAELSRGLAETADAMTGGRPVDRGAVSATNLQRLESMPGGEVRQEELRTGLDEDPDEGLDEDRLLTVPEAQNLDDEMTMCGDGTLKRKRDHTERMLLPSYGYLSCGVTGAGQTRGARAVRTVPVQYANAGIAASAGETRAPVVQEKTNYSNVNKQKRRLMRTPTIRGYTANYTSAPRRAEQRGDARGAKVRYTEHLRATRGRLHKDETSFEIDRSTGIVKTVPKEDLVIDAFGPDKATKRTRMITRSMSAAKYT